MELYSRMPPTIAPIRFIDIALEILVREKKSRKDNTGEKKEDM